jgi:hypothetical protein
VEDVNYVVKSKVEKFYLSAEGVEHCEETGSYKPRQDPMVEILRCVRLREAPGEQPLLRMTAIDVDTQDPVSELLVYAADRLRRRSLHMPPDSLQYPATLPPERGAQSEAYAA